MILPQIYLLADVIYPKKLLNHVKITLILPYLTSHMLKMTWQISIFE